MSLLADQSFLPSAALAVIGLLSGALILFWLWMAVDCLVHEPEATQKSAWLLVILFGNWIGALFYFFIRRRERLNPGRAEPQPASMAVRTAPRPIGAVISPSMTVKPVAGTAVTRLSDWTYLRLVLVILGVLVGLPTVLVIAMCCVMFVMI